LFGDRQSGAYMHKFSWTRILRHRSVKHRASLDDPALGDYWAWGRRKVPLPINKTTQELTDAQDGRCSICGGLLFAIEDRRKPRASGNGGWPPAARRSTRSPRRRTPNRVSYTPGADTATAWHCTTPTSHQGLLEPDAVKAASPVLRGARHSNVPSLPDTTSSPGDRVEWRPFRPAGETSQKRMLSLLTWQPDVVFDSDDR